MVIGRFRFLVIAIAVVIIAGFAFLGAQIWLLHARIDQLASKVNGIDATFGVKFEETSAKLDGASTKLHAISQRLSTEFKTIGVEIAARTSDHQKHRFPAQPSAVTSHLPPTRTCDRTKAHAAAEGPAVTRLLLVRAHGNLAEAAAPRYCAARPRSNGPLPAITFGGELGWRVVICGLSSGWPDGAEGGPSGIQLSLTS